MRESYSSLAVATACMRVCLKLSASQTDDILPFRNSLLGEYALLMAQPPLGLGLTEAEIEKVAKMGMECRFR